MDHTEQNSLFAEETAGVETLAEKYRPSSMQEFAGQKRIRPLLEKLLHVQRSVILYGPPGCGKTTFARMMADHTSLPFFSLNAITAGSAQIKNIQKPCVLFVDEIQYFNKKQQQILLPYMESGEIVLIGATTESPWHTLNHTLLSRASVLRFEEIEWQDIYARLKDVLEKEHIPFEDEALKVLSKRCGGDLRLAYTSAEMIAQAVGSIETDGVEEFLPMAIRQGFDDSQDDFYSWISALQKSIRGSDPDAAVFYLVKLLEGGALAEVCRRLLVMCSEDIGMAYPQAVSITYAAVQSAREMGMPEAKFPLSSLVIFLASCPKSFSAGRAYFQAKKDIEAGKGKHTPKHLSRDQAPGYISPHTFPNEYIDQPYLPEDLIGSIYYHPGRSKTEQSYARFLQQLKEDCRRNDRMEKGKKTDL